MPSKNVHRGEGQAIRREGPDFPEKGDLTKREENGTFENDKSPQNMLYLSGYKERIPNYQIRIHSEKAKWERNDRRIRGKKEVYSYREIGSKPMANEERLTWPNTVRGRPGVRKKRGDHEEQPERGYSPIHDDSSPPRSVTEVRHGRSFNLWKRHGPHTFVQGRGGGGEWYRFTPFYRCTQNGKSAGLLGKGEKNGQAVT